MALDLLRNGIRFAYSVNGEGCMHALECHMYGVPAANRGAVD
jgi:hypothetical protein